MSFTILLMLVTPAQVIQTDGRVCVDTGRSVECLSDTALRRHVLAFAPDVDADGFAAILDRVRKRGGSRDLLIRNNRFHSATIRKLRTGTYRAVQVKPIALPARPLRPLKTRTLNAPLGLGVDVHEGDNTDGQELHGPPGGGPATFACTGYSSNDTCKACCTATRMGMLPGIWAIATKCHAAANVNLWFHAGCAVLEGSLLAGLLYSTHVCNDNCEDTYWNDRSVDWQAQHHAPLRQSLSTGRYGQCEGWVRQLEWGGVRWLVLYDSVDRYTRSPNCYLLLNHVDTVPRVTQELYWGANNRYVKLVGDDSNEWDFRPVEYRIVDVDSKKSGRQIPYVGITGVDDTGVYLTLLRDGSRLYIDDSRVFESLKVWLYGKREGRNLRVRSGGILWWSAFMEGAL